MAYTFVEKMIMMKKLILALAFIYPIVVFGQNSGAITYQSIIKIDVELPEGMEQFAHMIPSEKSFRKVLLFDATQSLYQDVEKEVAEEEPSREENGVQMKIGFERSESKLYRNNESGEIIEERFFMDKKFLIKKNAQRHKWAMIREQKTILGYTCQKAIYRDSSETVVAWYTSQIPVSAGPGAYAGLPGMILELDIDEGQQRVVATDVALKALAQDSIVQPKKGKKVSEEVFNKIVDQKTKELQEQFGGSGNVIIKTQRG